MNPYRMPRNIGRYALSRRQPNIYAVILLFQLIEQIAALEPKPPITIGIITFNLFIFYATRFLGKSANLLPRVLVNLIRPFLSSFQVRQACVIPSAILSSPSQYKRLILASFTHLSDIHVLFNCSSLLYKGVSLEPIMGSVPFLALVFYLSLTSHGLYVAIAYVMRRAGLPYSNFNSCVAGFSGVLFGLKVILNNNPRYSRSARTSIFGIPVPSGPFAPWFELVVTSIIMPNVSFLGHLTGILAGLTYVYLPKGLARLVGPLVNYYHAHRSFQGYRAFQGEGRHLHSN